MLGPVIEFLNQPAFTLAGAPTSYAEILGFVTGLLCVWLVSRNNILTFPVGIANAAFFFVLFMDAKLYADAWLQVFFLVVQIAGWVAWAKAGPNRTQLNIGRASKLLMGAVLVALIVCVMLLVPVLREAHGSYPVADSTSTSLSVLAQCLMSYRLIQHWYLWIIADLIYIPLYAAKGLYFTSALYVLFLTLCVTGLLHWRRLMTEQQGTDTPSPLVEDTVPVT